MLLGAIFAPEGSVLFDARGQVLANGPACGDPYGPRGRADVMAVAEGVCERARDLECARPQHDLRELALAYERPCDGCAGAPIGDRDRAAAGRPDNRAAAWRRSADERPSDEVQAAYERRRPGSQERLAARRPRFG